jgi:hypothetical protein
VLKGHLHRDGVGVLAERDGEDTVIPVTGLALLAVYQDALCRSTLLQLQYYLPALRDERALALSEADRYAVVRGVARDGAAGVLAALVAEAVSASS